MNRYEQNHEVAGGIHKAAVGEKSGCPATAKRHRKLLPAEQGAPPVERPPEDCGGAAFQIVCICENG